MKAKQKSCFFFTHKKTDIKNILGEKLDNYNYYKILFFKMFFFFFYCSPVTGAMVHLALQEGREQG